RNAFDQDAIRFLEPLRSVACSHAHRPNRPQVARDGPALSRHDSALPRLQDEGAEEAGQVGSLKRPGSTGRAGKRHDDRGSPVGDCARMVHKQRNVTSHLPKEQHNQALATMRAAFKLEAAEGIAKLEQYASWLQREWPGAAASLREGLEELFTVNRFGLTSSLRRCLGTTNLIDNGHSAARERMHRVKHWQSGEMALRWTAASF